LTAITRSFTLVMPFPASYGKSAQSGKFLHG
jgi:hypothetical protein